MTKTEMLAKKLGRELKTEIKDIPIGKRFEINGVEFYIDICMGMSKYINYSLYCITDRKNICTRAKLDTIAKRILERVS